MILGFLLPAFTAVKHIYFCTSACNSVRYNGYKTSIRSNS